MAFLFERDVVDDDFAGEGLEKFFFRCEMVGVFFEGVEGGPILEAHEEGKVEGVIDDGAVARDGGPVLERGDESGGLLQLPGSFDEGGAVGRVAGALEPDEDGVLDRAGRRGGTRGQDKGEEQGEPSHVHNVGP